MIIGIGNDIVHVSRCEALLARHGDRALTRLLGEQERGRIREHRQPGAYLAKRFAAKEAFVKALGLGLRHGMRWSEIQVANDALGRPSLILEGRAKAHADSAGVRWIHLSLSDEKDLASAVVVLES